MGTRRPVLEIKLEQALVSYRRADERWTKKIKVLRARLGRDCSHTVYETYQWEHDNGYGQQSMNTGLRCVLCLATKPYMNMGDWVHVG